MNKIKQILIAASLITLSGNAAAVFMPEDGSSKADFFKDLMEQHVEAGGLTVAYEAIFLKVIKKSFKQERKMAKLDSGKGNPTKLTRKINKLENKIASLAGGLPGLASSIEIPVDGNGTGNGDHGSIPEPSTIALLGLGLIGIGAARHLRKKAR